MTCGMKQSFLFVCLDYPQLDSLGVLVALVVLCELFFSLFYSLKKKKISRILNT